MKKKDPITKQPEYTEKEKNFARLYVDNYFQMAYKTNTQIAIEAGYSKDSAHQRAYELTTYKLKPHVVNLIESLKEDFRQQNGITPDKHMARLNQLGRKAEEKDMIGVAVNAEVHRGKMAGYYVEKKLIGTQNLEDLTEDQIDQRLKEIEDQYDLITTHEDKDAE
tara:strand:+ start:2182 stop:2676 length:495 start_codon:yes stop_codon:yes gene_type:complete